MSFEFNYVDFLFSSSPLSWLALIKCSGISYLFRESTPNLVQKKFILLASSFSQRETLEYKSLNLVSDDLAELSGVERAEKKKKNLDALRINLNLTLSHTDEKWK